MLGEPIKPIIKLSEKEQKLYDFIKAKGEVSIRMIDENLDISFIGTLGGLKGRGLIDSYKRRPEGNTKYIKFFRLKENTNG